MDERGSTPTARLFFDPGCGPCRLFARVSEWASRSRLRAVPYDGDEARRELGDLSDDARFAYAHLVHDRERRSGDAIMTPLVGLTVGPTGERVVARVPPLDRGLRWMYGVFWNYRRTRGCAAPGPGGAA
ncbi:MAG TPA: hypothetical protein VEH57_07670 [Thermoplasmata archaeon]|nr:hypothetical protein [Thermoplasmata archaeon]